MNCPRRFSSVGDPERLRDRELFDLERELLLLTERFPFPLDLDRRCDVDLVLLAERRFVRLFDRDFRFIFRLDLERDRHGGVESTDLLDDREMDWCGLLERDRLRLECRDGEGEGEGDGDLERDFELDDLLILYIFGGVSELSLFFLTSVLDLSLCFLCPFGDAVTGDFFAFLCEALVFFCFFVGVVTFLAFLSFLE